MEEINTDDFDVIFSFEEIQFLQEPKSLIINYKKIMESVGSRCDVVLYDGAEHSFFNRGDDFIDTILKSDIFLKSNWYLSGEPTIKEQYSK